MPQSPSARAAHHKKLARLFALVAILVGYFLYLSWKFDASTGFGLAVLTWSFFVLCTPIADGGFILAFPIRLLLGIRMSVTQVVLWFVAIGINVAMLRFSQATYGLTLITRLLERILTQPYPYWSILAISALGTFLSIYFGDEVMDSATHPKAAKRQAQSARYKALLVMGLAAMTVFAYYHLLSNLGIALPSSHS